MAHEKKFLSEQKRDSSFQNKQIREELGLKKDDKLAGFFGVAK